MFGFLGKKRANSHGPVVKTRPEHCISRKNIDPDALRVLYRLSDSGYIAYLVGGGVRDLLLGRSPKDFDVGTDAKPNEVKHVFRRNCFLIGKRFRLAHVRFGQKVIETATFRKNAQTVGEIIEHAVEGPMEDNTFGTPETDANRRDFTVNGLFYDIKTFSVIDYVGGLEDLEKKVIRSIGDPLIRFREDPVRMMRAIKFAARLDFKIEKDTWAAMKELHAFIKNASIPRVCEEVFRLFTYGASSKAFKLMYECGMMGDLFPVWADHVTRTGGVKAPIWKYLAVLDKFEQAMRARDYEVPNGLRVAVLCTTLAREIGVREALSTVSKSIAMPKAAYFSAVFQIDALRRFAQGPVPNRKRFAYNRDFPDALDYARIICRAEGKNEENLNKWDDFAREVRAKEKERENNFRAGHELQEGK